MIIRKPPMGWNAWNTYDPDINETLMMDPQNRCPRLAFHRGHE